MPADQQGYDPATKRQPTFGYQQQQEPQGYGVPPPQQYGQQQQPQHLGYGAPPPSNGVYQQQPYVGSATQLPAAYDHHQHQPHQQHHHHQVAGSVATSGGGRGPLGVGGLPHARPFFGDSAADGIRHPHSCCCHYEPGPNIPLHWFDGGRGWVTKYFYDYILRDSNTYEPGKFRCQVPVGHQGQLCNHEVSEGDCCKGNCCWQSGTSAHLVMAEHVRAAHGMGPPARRQWSSGLCDTEGCCEAYCCAPCQGSRQIMALSGYEDKFHCGWCMFFTFLGFRVQRAGDRNVIYWIPPWIYVAILTRGRMVVLNNIDEGCCTTCLTTLCCSLCSVAQTYRELTASGVWPGSSYGFERPANYATVGYGPAVMA